MANKKVQQLTAVENKQNDKSKINWKVRVKKQGVLVSTYPRRYFFLSRLSLRSSVTPLTWAIWVINLLSVVEALFMVLSILGIVVDPTTDGVGDSKQALTYTEPKKIITDLTPRGASFSFGRKELLT